MKLSSKKFFFSTVFWASSVALAQDIPQVVNIYTYDSFTSEWGAGPSLKKAFEAKSPQCQINFIAFEDAGVMFNRLRLEGAKTKADIALGLDNFVMSEARKSGLFAKTDVDLSQLDLGFAWGDKTFVPYDFGTYAFVYDKNKVQNPPRSLKELIEREDLRVIYQDPRTSSVGRGLLVWLNQIYPEDQVVEAWKQLAKHTVTVGKGWSDTYGAFLRGEADLVLSYNTSPLYHQLFENKDNYSATTFAEGAIQQVELAAKVAHRHNPCADQFLQFLLIPTSQQILAKTNIMLPVTQDEVEPHFDALKQQMRQMKWIDTTKITSEQLKQWVNTWQKTLTQ